MTKIITNETANFCVLSAEQTGDLTDVQLRDATRDLCTSTFLTSISSEASHTEKASSYVHTSAIYLAQWFAITDSANKKSNHAVPEAKDIKAKMNEWVIADIEKRKVNEADRADEKNRLLASAPKIARYTQLLLSGDCIVGITEKTNKLFIEDENVLFDEALHCRRVFHKKNNPFPKKDEGKNERESDVSDAWVCTTVKNAEDIFKAVFESKPLNEKQTGFLIEDNPKKTVDFKGFTEAENEIRNYIANFIYNHADGLKYDERLGSNIFSSGSLDDMEKGNFDNPLKWSTNFASVKDFSNWLAETIETTEKVAVNHYEAQKKAWEVANPPKKLKAS